MEPLRVVLPFAAFALFHSLTVSEPYERVARRLLGEDRFRRWHRLLFTLYSTAATALLLAHLRSLPDAPLYRVEGGARWLLHGVGAAGLALVAWTPWDLLDFLGVRPLLRPLPVPPAPPALHTGKAYGIVRHPVYLGVSLFLLSRPAQTEVSFLFSLLCAAYFVAGSFHEERRMVHLHGAAYEEYRRRVPPFLPAPWRKRS